MPTPTSYDYAIVRVVPQVERGEFINAGVILFSRALDYLAARVALDRRRLAVLAPHCDVDQVQQHLDVIPRLCAGDRQAGPIAALPTAERFHWLVAPRSTVIQTSPVHSGLTTDPAADLDELLARFVTRESSS